MGLPADEIRTHGRDGLPQAWRSVFVYLVCLAVASLVSACAGNYGRLKGDQEMAMLFLKGPLPDYSYYYTGRASIPDALIGIRPEYTLKSSIWHPVESMEEVHHLASRVALKDTGRARGSIILDPLGKEAGIWFSTYTSTTVKLNPGNEIIVYSPYSPSDTPALFHEPND